MKVFTGACLTQFIVIGFLFSYEVFFSAFGTEFGWSWTLLSSCSVLAFFVMRVLAIIAGRLSDRYGPRLVLGFTGLTHRLGFILMSHITQQWQLLMIFVVFIGLKMSTAALRQIFTSVRPKSANRTKLFPTMNRPKENSSSNFSACINCTKR